MPAPLGRAQSRPLPGCVMASTSIDDTLGAVLIGTYISLMYIPLSSSVWCAITDISRCRLFGLALHQAYEYYIHYPYDKPWLKTYVNISQNHNPIRC